MISIVIDKWFSTAKRILFKYKNGFYDLPIMSNSPEIIVKSLTKMPFIFHDPQIGKFGSNNPFLNANVYYQEIEKGLWYMTSRALYKENVNYIMVNNKNLSSDYYHLFLETEKNIGHFKNAILNGISYANTSWVLIKPNATNTQCRFKGSDVTSQSVYFNEEWLKTVLDKDEVFANSSIKKFFDSKAELVIWPEQKKISKKFEKTSRELLEKKINNFDVQISDWQAFIFDILYTFIDRYNSDNIDERLLEIAHIDRKKIQEAEKLLLDSIQGNFMGIENIAAKVRLSPTKLKSNFKLVFGESIFQYFRKQQLESAKVLLEKNELSIKVIAELYGYNNQSKFTAAYKDHFDSLPSECRNK